MAARDLNVERNRVNELAAQILSMAKALPEGELLRAGALLHLGRKSAVNRSLSSLVSYGKLIRISRGAYAAVIETKFGPRAPHTHLVVEAIARTTGEIMTRSPAEAANLLGLTTKVPVCLVYLTTGPTRTLSFSMSGMNDTANGKGLSVELRHAPRWKLVLAGRKAGAVIGALAWATTPIEIALFIERKKRDARGLDRATLERARKRRILKVTETLREVAPLLSLADRTELLEARPLLPSWIAKPMTAELSEGPRRGRFH